MDRGEGDDGGDGDGILEQDVALPYPGRWNKPEIMELSGIP